MKKALLFILILSAGVFQAFGQEYDYQTLIDNTVNLETVAKAAVKQTKSARLDIFDTLDAQLDEASQDLTNAINTEKEISRLRNPPNKLELSQQLYQYNLTSGEEQFLSNFYSPAEDNPTQYDLNRSADRSREDNDRIIALIGKVKQQDFTILIGNAADGFSEIIETVNDTFYTAVIPAGSSSSTGGTSFSGKEARILSLSADLYRILAVMNQDTTSVSRTMEKMLEIKSKQSMLDESVVLDDYNRLITNLENDISEALEEAEKRAEEEQRRIDQIAANMEITQGDVLTRLDSLYRSADNWIVQGRDQLNEGNGPQAAYLFMEAVHSLNLLEEAISLSETILELAAVQAAMTNNQTNQTNTTDQNTDNTQQSAYDTTPRIDYSGSLAEHEAAFEEYMNSMEAAQATGDFAAAASFFKLAQEELLLIEAGKILVVESEIDSQQLQYEEQSKVFTSLLEGMDPAARTRYLEKESDITESFLKAEQKLQGSESYLDYLMVKDEYAQAAASMSLLNNEMLNELQNLMRQNRNRLDRESSGGTGQANQSRDNNSNSDENRRNNNRNNRNNRNNSEMPF